MSHELRTPMNGLLGMLDLALDGGVNGEQKDQLETAQRCAYSLLALLNDILDLSKIEAGKMMLEKIPFEARARGGGLREIPGRQGRAKENRSALRGRVRPAAGICWATLCASARSWPICCRTPSNLPIAEACCVKLDLIARGGRPRQRHHPSESIPDPASPPIS